MSECLPSSIIHSLEALPHNVVVINSHGVIQFTSRKWKRFIREYGLSPHKEWHGANYSERMQELILFPDQWAKLYKSVEHVLRREHLVFSSEFSIQTANQGQRIFCLETYPLLLDSNSTEAAFLISLYDVGPFIQEDPLIPICASCKSIRNLKDEWITIERFLKHQLNLQFTHDICPDCIRQLYPRYAGAFSR